MSKISRPQTTRSGPTARERRGSPSAHADRRAASRSTEGNAQSHREDEAPPDPTAPTPQRGARRLRFGGCRGRACPPQRGGRDCGYADGAGRDAPFTPQCRGARLGAASTAPIIRERRPSPRIAGARFAEHSLDTTDNHRPVAKGARRMCAAPPREFLLPPPGQPGEESRTRRCGALLLLRVPRTPLPGGHAGLDRVDVLATSGPGGLSADLAAHRSTHCISSLFFRSAPADRNR